MATVPSTTLSDSQVSALQHQYSGDPKILAVVTELLAARTYLRTLASGGSVSQSTAKTHAASFDGGK